MDTIYAPYLKGEETLMDAVVQMKNIQASVLVVNKSGRYLLFTSRVVFEGYHKGLETCSALDEAEAYTLADLSERSIGALYPAGNLSDLFENLLTAPQSADYGFLYPGHEEDTPNIVLVLTRRERLRADLVGDNCICVCTGPHRHIDYNDPELDGRECDYCPPHVWHCTKSR